jgi:hypothetical protein
VVEDYVDGEQYEFDGYVGPDGQPVFFDPLYQEWNKDDTQILLYTGHLPPPDGWEYTMGTVLQAIGINAGPFCIEARYARGAWRVIEVHARLGEETVACDFTGV